MAQLLPACSKTNIDPDCAQKEIFCVDLVTAGSGKIDDHSLNQATWEGLQAAQAESGIVIN